MIGRTISQYRIVEKLGEGGMGVVYKAEDTQLGRFVALKSLPPGQLADPARRARFLREARAASALNHPNIVTIYDLISDGADQFLVMEFVDGKTLERVIHGRGLPFGEALRLAIPIADALAEAHKAGITHRDLKPGNVIVANNGLVKLLDFGLAKLTDPRSAPSASDATVTAGHTEHDAIIGTTSYMSPEQAQGKPVDTRSDIFSFGAVLYEMITGRRAFQGDNKMSTLVSVIEKEPTPASGIIPNLPPDVDRLIHRCLRKDPAKRAQTMVDLKVALEELKEESDSGRLSGVVAARPPQPAARRWWWIAAPALAAIAAVAIWMAPAKTENPSGGPRKMDLTTYPGVEISPAISPDGKQVAFSWNGEKQDNLDIYVKMIDSGEPLRLTRDPNADQVPVWSPDGRQIAFVRGAAIYVVPPLGGADRKLADANATGLAWRPDGKAIVYGSLDGLFELDIASGSSRRLTTSSNSGDSSPSFSPDGVYLAYTHYRTASGARDLFLIAYPGGEPKRLNAPPGFVGTPVFLDAGREILYSTQWGPLSRVAVAGGTPSPLPISDNPAVSPSYHAGTARLVYSRGDGDMNAWAADLSPVPSAKPVISSTKRDFAVQPSPDGTRLAFTSDRSGGWEIWRSDSDGANQVQLTSLGDAIADGAYWSPDAKQIVFAALIKGNRDIYIVGAEGGPVRQLTSEPSDDGRPSFSRDGKWIYFRSNRSKREEIWKMPREGGPPQQITRNGGFDIRESMDGSTLYFTKARLGSGLWKMPAGGSQEAAVPGLERLRPGNWSLASNGIYWISYSPVNATLMRWDPAKQTSTSTGLSITSQIFNAAPVLSVTLDGKRAYWHQDDTRGADLVLIENFR